MKCCEYSTSMLTSLSKSAAFYIEFFYKTTYLNEEVKRTEPPPKGSLISNNISSSLTFRENKLVRLSLAIS
jgi:hypothetical protein